MTAVSVAKGGRTAAAVMALKHSVASGGTVMELNHASLELYLGK